MILKASSAGAGGWRKKEREGENFIIDNREIIIQMPDDSSSKIM